VNLSLGTKFIQSFADIAKATPNQLQSLPGFGQVKVKRMKDAFEKPFRNKSATSLLTYVPSREHDATDRDQATSVVPTGSLQQVSRRSRSASPPWDIELDLNLPDESGTPPLPAIEQDAKKGSGSNGENMGSARFVRQ